MFRTKQTKDCKEETMEKVGYGVLVMFSSTYFVELLPLSCKFCLASPFELDCGCFGFFIIDLFYFSYLIFFFENLLLSFPIPNTTKKNVSLSFIVHNRLMGI